MVYLQKCIMTRDKQILIQKSSHLYSALCVHLFLLMKILALDNLEIKKVSISMKSPDLHEKPLETAY